MPQMAPLMWFPLFLSMTMIIVWVKSNSFFLYNIKPSNKNTNSSLPNKPIWMW